MRADEEDRPPGGGFGGFLHILGKDSFTSEKATWATPRSDLRGKLRGPVEAIRIHANHRTLMTRIIANLRMKNRSESNWIESGTQELRNGDECELGNGRNQCGNQEIRNGGGSEELIVSAEG